MPKLAEHSSSDYVKMLFVGNSGAGKTGALTSLVKAGYKIRVIDLDSGLDALVNHCRDQQLDLKNVDYVTLRDRMKMTAGGPKVAGAPKAYVDVLSYLEKWEDDSDPAEWGPDTILVLDSLTNAGRAAFQWAKAANPMSKDPRQWYKTAQDLIEDLIANVTADSFATNVIVISHVDIVDTQVGMKGYVSSIGKALGAKLPRFFNTLILSEVTGSGKNVKRKIKTLPTAMLDLKNPAPMRIEAEYELNDGLAQIFEKLKGK